MNTFATGASQAGVHPISVHIEPAIEDRNRLTTAFRLILAIPHLILVGGPIAATLSWTSGTEPGLRFDWGAGGGVLGVVAVVVAMIAWFAILFTRRHPKPSGTLPRATFAGASARSHTLLCCETSTHRSARAPTRRDSN